jgi:hypothetical protein
VVTLPASPTFSERVCGFEPQHTRWSKEFDEAVARRDGLPEDSAARNEAQEDVERLYEKMYEEGYFRDSYNASSVLWPLGLSWWTDVGALLETDDDERVLTPDGVVRLLALLAELGGRLRGRRRETPAQGAIPGGRVWSPTPAHHLLYPS